MVFGWLHSLESDLGPSHHHTLSGKITMDTTLMMIKSLPIKKGY
jgi:hypothetical protein